MKRLLTPEWMDEPTVDPTEHRRALAGLRRINLFSAVAGMMAREVRTFARSRQLQQLRMLDVASGGGDVPISVAQRLQASGIRTDLTLFDQSDVGLTPAIALAYSLGVSAQGNTGNALEALPQQAYDVVTCSLFLHHLTADQCIQALVQMKSVARGLILVSDLRRCVAGWLGATVGCRLLSRSPLVHHDGPASVRAAWTPEELHDLAHCAGLTRATIRRCYPCRMLLVAPAD